MNPILKSLGLPAIVSACALISLPASAEGRTEHVAAEALSHKVYFADLNLSGKAGVEKLYHRIHAASEKVCAPMRDGGRFSNHHVWRQCYSKALQDAVDTVGHPGLTEHHYAHTHRVGDDLAMGR